MTPYLIGSAIALAILLLWYISTYNSLIAKRNNVEQCQSGISVLLKQRNDLLPNLVAAVQKYTQYEGSLLRDITELRSRMLEAKDQQEETEFGERMTKLIHQLNVAVENYPELKANDQFMQLERAVEDMEYQLQAMRRSYNAAAVAYNNAIEMFPSSIVARAAHHSKAPLIEVPAEEKANVNLNALFNPKT